MPAFTAPAKSALLTANATTAGYATVASTVGFFLNQRVWISSDTEDSIECTIVDFLAGGLIGLRSVTSKGYGHTDLSVFDTVDNARLDAPQQVIYGETQPNPLDAFSYDGYTLSILSAVDFVGPVEVTIDVTLPLVLTGSTISINSATGSVPGVVTTSTQSFAGAKSFNNGILTNTIGVTSASGISVYGAPTDASNAVGIGIGSSTSLANAAAKLVIIKNSSTEKANFGITGLLNFIGPVSGANFINALDGARLNFSTADASAYLYRSATDTIRTPGAFTADGALSGSNLSGSSSGANSGDITLASVGSTPAAAGASLSGQVLTLQPADGTNAGLVSTTTQTLAGAKTLSSALTLSAATTNLTFSGGAASFDIVRATNDLNMKVGANIYQKWEYSSGKSFFPYGIDVAGNGGGTQGIAISTASGSVAINMLNGARLSLGSDTSSYLYRSATDTIRTPGALVADTTISGGASGFIVSASGQVTAAQVTIANGLVFAAASNSATLSGQVANGATAVQCKIGDYGNSYTNAGARLVSIINNGVQEGYFDNNAFWNGGVNAMGGLVSSVLAAPVNATHTTATTGGTLAAGTYYYRIAATVNGYLTLGSTETSIVVPAGTSTNTVTVKWGKVIGASGYKVYGRSTGAELLMATLTEGHTTQWLDDGSVTPSGALPTADTTGTAQVTGLIVTANNGGKVGLSLPMNSGISLNGDAVGTGVTAGSTVLVDDNSDFIIYYGSQARLKINHNSGDVSTLLNLIPQQDNTRRLGDTTHRWQSIHVVNARDADDIIRTSWLPAGAYVSDTTGGNKYKGASTDTLAAIVHDFCSYYALTTPGAKIASFSNNLTSSNQVSAINHQGYLSSAQPHPGLGRKSGTYEAITTADTADTAVNLPAPSYGNLEVATAAPAATGGTRMYISHATNAVINNVGGIVGPYTVTRPLYRPRISGRILTDTTITGQRVWFGLSRLTLDQLAIATGPTASAIDFVAIGYDTAVNANWQICSGDGTNYSCASTGVAVVANTEYAVDVDWTTAGTLRAVINGTGTNKTTNLSTGAVDLGVQASITSLTALTSRTFFLGSICVEQN